MWTCMMPFRIVVVLAPAGGNATTDGRKRLIDGVIVDYQYPSWGAPGKATNPDPSHQATGIGVDTILSWTAGADATSRDVYFGTTSPGDAQGNQVELTYDPPGDLDGNTTYYWRIDEKNAAQTTTGDVWYFTTETPPPDIFVYDISMSSYEPKSGYYAAYATIWIQDDDSEDIDGATVTGEWSDATTKGEEEGDTGGDGKITLESDDVKGGGTFRFTVTDVSATGYIYNSSKNNETYDEITVP